MLGEGRGRDEGLAGRRPEGVRRRSVPDVVALVPRGRSPADLSVGVEGGVGRWWMGSGWWKKTEEGGRGKEWRCGRGGEGRARGGRTDENRAGSAIFNSDCFGATATPGITYSRLTSIPDPFRDAS